MHSTTLTVYVSLCITTYSMKMYHAILSSLQCVWRHVNVSALYLYGIPIYYSWQFLYTYTSRSVTLTGQHLNIVIVV